MKLKKLISLLLVAIMVMSVVTARNAGREHIRDEGLCCLAGTELSLRDYIAADPVRALGQNHARKLGSTTGVLVKISDYQCHQGLGFEKMFDCFDYRSISQEEARKLWCIPAVSLVEDARCSHLELIGAQHTDCFRLERYEIRESVRIPSEDMVTIAHGDCPEDAFFLQKILKEEYGVRSVITGFVGPILGAHTGPGVLGLFHLGKER